MFHRAFSLYLFSQKPREALKYEKLCVIWYYLYNLKNVKNTHGGVLLLVKLQTKTCNFTKSSTAPWVFLTFFKLNQIPHAMYHICCTES